MRNLVEVSLPVFNFLDQFIRLNPCISSNQRFYQPLKIIRRPRLLERNYMPCCLQLFLISYYPEDYVSIWLSPFTLTIHIYFIHKSQISYALDLVLVVWNRQLTTWLTKIRINIEASHTFVCRYTFPQETSTHPHVMHFLSAKCDIMKCCPTPLFTNTTPMSYVKVYESNDFGGERNRTPYITMRHQRML